MTQTKVDIPATQARLMAQKTACSECQGRSYFGTGLVLVPCRNCHGTGSVLMFPELRRDCPCLYSKAEDCWRCEAERGNHFPCFCDKPLRKHHVDDCVRCSGTEYVWNDAPDAVAEAIRAVDGLGEVTFFAGQNTTANVYLPQFRDGHVKRVDGLIKINDALLVALDRAVEGA